MLAVELTSMEALSRQLVVQCRHCTSGGAPLELWY